MLNENEKKEPGNKGKRESQGNKASKAKQKNNKEAKPRTCEIKHLF